ncbi:TPA: hypothetical protein ACOQ31_005482 [Bacillus cereus]|uniref:hypothetical protein n=1 Tax=Bacillus cereus TaxID=1396 RepID=UPI0019284424|nr:hypothetical protein [Bacillus cereus]MBL3769211.1 hypothetical protein [Bacillus cereus]MBL3774996.1 hypothetical protein [Bacillus cereus]MBL3780803.1 hypothetical protein [Bacillus cereus]MBL3792103.1 hypothetical protein [Bacillus cereus]
MNTKQPLTLNRWGDTSQTRTFRNKTNENWDKLEGTYRNIQDNSEYALTNAVGARDIAARANQLSESVQEQLNQVVISGDSGPEAAQARVDADGFSHETLKDRIDTDFTRNTNELKKLNGDVSNLNTHLLDVAKVNINQFPRGVLEIHDIPRINRAISYLNALGKRGELHFNEETYTVIPQKPEPEETSEHTKLKRILLKDNVSLIGIKGRTFIRVSDENPNYHALIEEDKPIVRPIRNVTIKGITFDQNVYNNVGKPDYTINNQRECIRIYQSENIVIEGCKFIGNGTNPINFRIGLNQDEMNKGNYPNKNVKIIDNEIIFVALDSLTYYDNTFITVTGEDVTVARNKIRSEHGSIWQNGGENTAIEVSGKNIVVELNNINNYLLGIDVATFDTYKEDRNILIKENFMTTVARGVKVWCGKSVLNIIDGVRIKGNVIKMNLTTYKNRTEMSTRAGVCLSNHGTDSIGQARNILIESNHIILDDESRDYLLTLEYPGSYYANVLFDSHFAGIYLGGKMNIPRKFTIKGNKIENFSAPGFSVGCKDVIQDVNVFDNKFINCGYGGRSAIITVLDRAQNFVFKNNQYIDTGSPAMLGKRLYSFRRGTNSESKFWEFVFDGNMEFIKIKSSEFVNDFDGGIGSLIFDKFSHYGYPQFPPMRQGMQYFDKEKKELYFSIGTTYIGDWIKLYSQPINPPGK